MASSVPQMDMDKETLSKYDGTHSLGTCTCVKGTIFDVSSKPQFYGPGGSYHALAGRDCSRALAKSSLKSEDVESTSLDDLTPDEINTLNQWHDSFVTKYPIVGKLI